VQILTRSFVICLVRNHFVHVCSLHEQIASQVGHFHHLAKAGQDASPRSDLLQLLQIKDSPTQCRRALLHQLHKIAQLGTPSASAATTTSSSGSAGRRLQAGLGDALREQGDHIAHVLGTDHGGQVQASTCLGQVNQGKKLSEKRVQRWNCEIVSFVLILYSSIHINDKLLNKW